MERRDASRDRAGSGPGRHARPDGGAAGDPREEDAGPTGRGDRLRLGAETGLRWAVQAVALALWAPFGFLFWLPFLLRRTIGYVLAVLYVGLTGGDADRAAGRWEQAVDFYQIGFQRILHALSSQDSPPAPTTRSGREPEGGVGRFVLEAIWAAAVWTAALWALGVWPEAPEAIRSAAARGFGAFDAWVRGLLGR